MFLHMQDVLMPPEMVLATSQHTGLHLGNLLVYSAYVLSCTFGVLSPDIRHAHQATPCQGSMVSTCYPSSGPCAYRSSCQQWLRLHDIDTPVPEVPLAKRPAIDQHLAGQCAFPPQLARQRIQLRSNKQKKCNMSLHGQTDRCSCLKRASR